MNLLDRYITLYEIANRYGHSAQAKIMWKKIIYILEPQPSAQ